MNTTGRVAVTGASGFVGTGLCRRLTDEGYDVRALTRRPDAYRGAGQAVRADVLDPGSLDAALAGASTAFYLVHSLNTEDFAALDAEAARNFGAAAHRAGVRQIVYLGGLGRDEDELSPHLASRRAVEHLLAAAGVPVTTLRAAIVVGRGGLSWELIRSFAMLPVLAAPVWIETRSQPIALTDLLTCLTGVLGRPEAIGRTFDVGGPEVLSYGDMLRGVARVVDDRFLPIVAVPLLSMSLSATGISLLSGTDRWTVQHLLDSMSTETVVLNDAIDRLVPGPRTPYADAVRAAL